jgi:hypothetical protein
MAGGTLGGSESERQYTQPPEAWMTLVAELTDLYRLEVWSRQATPGRDCFQPANTRTAPGVSGN